MSSIEHGDVEHIPVARRQVDLVETTKRLARSSSVMVVGRSLLKKKNSGLALGLLDESIEEGEEEEPTDGPHAQRGPGVHNDDSDPAGGAEQFEERPAMRSKRQDSAEIRKLKLLGSPSDLERAQRLIRQRDDERAVLRDVRDRVKSHSEQLEVEGRALSMDDFPELCGESW